jgi:hypothetical protein
LSEPRVGFKSSFDGVDEPFDATKNAVAACSVTWNEHTARFVTSTYVGRRASLSADSRRGGLGKDAPASLIEDERRLMKRRAAASPIPSCIHPCHQPHARSRLLLPA